jgi:hypothetical protein
MFNHRSRFSIFSTFVSRLINLFLCQRLFKTKRLLKWVILSTVVIICAKPLSAFSQDSTKKDTAQVRHPIEAFWIQNLFFTRGLDLRNELWNVEGDGAFRSRWRYIFSHPFGPRFQAQLEVPFALVVPVEGKSVAGLGNISLLVQGKVQQRVFFNIQQLLGLNIVLPTGSHRQTGSGLMILNPKYQITFLTHHWLFIVPNITVNYIHSVIEPKDAKNVRVLTLSPFVSLPHILPENIGLSGTLTLEWDFDFQRDNDGGFLTAELAKKLNPRTALNLGFSSTISNFTREVLWEQRYEVDILTIF